MTDAAALASPTDAPDVVGVAPEKTAEESLTAGSANWTTRVVGTTPPWVTVRARTLASGSFFTAPQEASGADVVVLGSATAGELFGSTDVVGQSLDIGGTTFTVIGVLASEGASTSTNLDDTAVIPLTTAADQVFGGTDRASVSTIFVQAASTARLSAAYQEVDQTLLNLHSITDSANADFTVSSQDSLVSTATAVAKTLTVLLTGIAALSLLVGGIGVMNIMLVSVTERTREIGLRKALGAPPWAIRRQFLVEAAVLGLSGGVLGAALGIVGGRGSCRGSCRPRSSCPARPWRGAGRRDRDRPGVRRLPRHAGRAARPDRRVAQRVTSKETVMRHRTMIVLPLALALGLAGCGHTSQTTAAGTAPGTGGAVQGGTGQSNAGQGGTGRGGTARGARTASAAGRGRHHRRGRRGRLAHAGPVPHRADRGHLVRHDDDRQDGDRGADRRDCRHPASSRSPPAGAPGPAGARRRRVRPRLRHDAAATTVRISAPVNGACQLGGRPGRLVRGWSPERCAGAVVREVARPSGAPGGAPTGGAGGPGGFAGFAGFTAGQVTATGAGSITVQTTGRDGTTSTATVDVDASTTYTATAASDASAIAVGLCAQAVGPTDTRGQMAATRITLSDPGSTGCTTGFGGRAARGAGTGSSAGAGGQGA